MTTWDHRIFLRALAATFVAIVVIWLVTAASDEGQLGFAARAGRTLPLAPLASVVGVGLALGSARTREEARALEALGRTPASNARGAVLGAALPSVLVGALIALSPAIDVAGFYPRPPRGDSFVYRDGAFISATLGVRIEGDGRAHPLTDETPAPDVDDGLPRGARSSAGAATALAGLALALAAGRAILRASLVSRAGIRLRRITAIAQIIACAAATLIAFQAAAARITPAALVVVPSALLLLAVLLGYRRRYAS